ncbi:MAG: translocation/assembly module TamB [Acidobacteria bacterium]|nr:translocation/assembly module TamB [Acidobacteriota bacterium]
MRRWVTAGLIALGALAVLGIGLSEFAQSDWVREILRRKVVAAVEAGTGGKCSIQSLRVDLLRLRAQVDGFVLKGRERAGQQPFIAVQRADATLKVLSWWGRSFRLNRLAFQKPQVRIYVYADGSTNIPDNGKPRMSGTVMEDLIRLQIGQLEIGDGLFEFDRHERKFELKAEGLDLRLAYDAPRPRYRTLLSARQLSLPGGIRTSVGLEAWLEGNRIAVSKAELKMGESRVELSGALEDFRQPRIHAGFSSAIQMRDVEISPVREGFLHAGGEVTYDGKKGLVLTGDLRGEQLGYQSRDFQMRRVALSSRYRLTPSELDLDGLSITSPYGNWNGKGAIQDWSVFRLEGETSEVPLSALQALWTDEPYEWNGIFSGELQFSGELAAGGLRHAVVTARQDVAHAEGQMPLQGSLDAVWRQDCACIEFASSSLAAASARLNFQGVLGQRMEAALLATGLEGIEPAIGLLMRRADYRLPVALSNGVARANVIVTGPLDAPQIDGHISVSNLAMDNSIFNQVDSAFRLSGSQLELKDVKARRESVRVLGELSLGLRDWGAELDSPLSARLELQNGDFGNLCRLLKVPMETSGQLDLSVNLSGTLGEPHGTAHTELRSARLGTEPIQKLTGDASMSKTGAWQLKLDREQTRLEVHGDWNHPSGDFKNGSIAWKAALAGLALKDWDWAKVPSLPLDSTLSGEFSGQATVTEGELDIKSVQGSLQAPALRAGEGQMGAVKAMVETKGGVAMVSATMAMPQGVAELNGSLHLKGNYDSEGVVRIPRLTFSQIKALMSVPRDQWPVRGFLDGELRWRGPLREPKKLTAEATIRQFQVRPRQIDLPEAQVDTSELVLRNSGPLVLTLDATAVRVRSARFTALETDLQLTGAYLSGTRLPWNLDVLGKANLAVLGSFYRQLTAAGSAQVTASLRGASADPQMSGKMTINNAAFYLQDVAYGIEKVNGSIFFEKNRANIEKLDGVMGGGQFSFTGFAGFTRGELAYRLQMNTTNVRVRYPEGVSTTLDSELALTGSAARSLLSGTITIKRSGFIVSGDLASTVGNTGNPISSTALQNEFLRNLQFDVRVRSAPDAVLISNYTSDLQTQADLRLRGSPAKPVLLGSVKANQGQVNFFGNNFIISRGEVLFYNTAVVQPQLDLDLETRVRGITVYLNVNGPLSRLNVTYRSEPPLQSSEILALLTVGRAPTSTSRTATTSDSIRSQTVMENSAASNTLLGTALSAGLNSRTERFFGASRIRIDPNAVGVDNLPQARLSIEQSISRDITLTYITSLNSSKQQVVRLEWDMSRQWSIIAIKDENGAFAVDFLFRRRFK